MRFIHMADVHLGAVPDSGCPWSAFRENEIWETFVRVIDQIREEKIELLLIAGDLFHRQPLPSQIERVSQLCIHTGYRSGMDGRKSRLFAGRFCIS